MKKLQSAILTALVLLLVAVCAIPAAAETRKTIFLGSTTGSLGKLDNATSSAIDIVDLIGNGRPVAYLLYITGSGKIDLTYTVGAMPTVGTYIAPAADAGYILRYKGAGTYNGEFTPVPGDKLKFNILETDNATVQVWLDIVYY